MSVARRVKRAGRALARATNELSFAPPVAYVYQPLDYARRTHGQYLERFADSTKRVLYLGMNPGPFGMAQTGVPFGEVAMVRDWMGIEGKVGRPEVEHPKRPITGFACERSEVSGARLWGAIARHYGTPEKFFATSFIANYCPLVFMEESGRNRTPDKLPPAERDALYAACDVHLRALVRALEPEHLVGVGKFAAQRAADALGEAAPTISSILHPSPANPRANKDWEGEVRQQLAENGICVPKRRRKTAGA